MDSCSGAAEAIAAMSLLGPIRYQKYDRYDEPEGQAGELFNLDPKYEALIVHNRKTHEILTAPPLLVFALIMYDQVAQDILTGPLGLFGSIGLTFGCMFPLICGMHQKFPINFILLAGFTLGESIMVGNACVQAAAQTHYQDLPDPGWNTPVPVVFQALLVTSVVVVALWQSAVWAWQSKRDFGNFMGYALVAFMALFVGSLVNLFIGSSMMNLMISVGMACVFGFYLLFDIQWIFSDHYILLSLNLYLDIVVLFMEILRILANTQSADN